MRTPRRPARADRSEHFPLRQAVQCAHCGRPLGGAYSGGRNTEYPYYFSLNKKCLRYRKSFSRDEIHGQFEALLKKLPPADEIIDIATTIFQEAWEKRSSGAAERTALLRREATTTDKSMGLLVAPGTNDPCDPQKLLLFAFLLAIHRRRAYQFIKNRHFLEDGRVFLAAGDGGGTHGGARREIRSKLVGCKRILTDLTPDVVRSASGATRSRCLLPPAPRQMSLLV
ncbi:hypothetical protein J2W42_004254 [Rhizobium tibeticum]|uniref:hypothetical protein n=1 Tax=Rhizobium tibeticum TaxID=501024 RepID=UPI00278449F5|nr:hypothetical protein [Rhizobium tibeticum]MDP9811390.1 hypothetical protein [Rhizobium tibeticum]